ncbi:MAG: S-adenosylmethionine:tRNA ribosyltransferase-isomerase [Bacteroidaceae bacterium]|nr:S-adenosylmethionine:tRNA ribosyltransferase-isomerase [Bacteroidaceae bacterium]
MDTKHIQIRDYDYALPEDRIAKFPLPERDASKLLIYDKGQISETKFRSLPSLLPEGSLMVFNNTRVIQARLHFRKKTPSNSPVKGEDSGDVTAKEALPLREGLGGSEGSGALIEVFLLEPACPVEYQENFASKGSCTWYCLVGNSKKWKEGKLTRTLTIDHSTLTITAERIGTHGTSQEIRFEWRMDPPLPSLKGREKVSPLRGDLEGSLTVAEIIDAVGELPIPPYLNRKTEESDKTTYQTVYSKIKGSVAAPTAGLHFTQRVLQDIDARGIEREEVTLHVGAGTFRPVKSEDIGGHDMHTEHIAVHRRTIERLLAHNGEAIAVGTTSVRTLESLYYMGVLVDLSKSPLKGETSYADNSLPLREGWGGSGLHVPQWMPYEYDNSLSTIEALTALLRYMDERGEEVLHASTQIIIAPGYKYHIVRRMITNFHQPQSTLLLLVSAFIGDAWHDVYDYALGHDFRFLSYGDSSMLVP